MFYKTHKFGTQGKSAQFKRFQNFQITKFGNNAENRHVTVDDVDDVDDGAAQQLTITPQILSLRPLLTV